jgi:transcriptional regulator with XRE-family HTH domain
MTDDVDDTLAAVGSRLRAMRARNQMTLTAVATSTGISTSTLSRLESGRRKPTLELLLPLTQAYGVTLDELVQAPQTDDPRVQVEPIVRHGLTFVPLTRQNGGLKAFKQIIPAGWSEAGDELQTHPGYEWLYVLSGRLRLQIAEHDLRLGQGEAAEFDTRLPHAISNASDENPVELIMLFGQQGERVHVRARPRS